MKRDLPESVSREELKIDVRDIEPLLSGPVSQLKPFEPGMVKLSNGKTLVFRALKMEEVPGILAFLKKVMDVDHDFYDIVGARVYAEVLAWQRNRLKDVYTIVGVIDGQLAGFANARKRDDEVHISLHSMSYMRGGRVGAAMYYAKAQYAFDVLGAEEWWSTFESYNGWMRWGLGMAQPAYPWPEYQHELGGATVYYINKEYWESTVKNYVKEMVGNDIVRPVPADILASTEPLQIPDQPDV
jgi:hypothetical protein